MGVEFVEFLWSHSEADVCMAKKQRKRCFLCSSKILILNSEGAFHFSKRITPALLILVCPFNMRILIGNFESSTSYSHITVKPKISVRNSVPFKCWVLNSILWGNHAASPIHIPIFCYILQKLILM